MIKVDLNSDIGESFGRYTLGMDKEIISLISSCNVACGYHASDPTVMHQTVKLAGEAGAAIGQALENAGPVIQLRLHRDLLGDLLRLPDGHCFLRQGSASILS